MREDHGRDANFGPLILDMTTLIVDMIKQTLESLRTIHDMAVNSANEATNQIQAMMQQAKDMQERLQKEMTALRVEATAGGGMVTVVMTGTKQLKAITLDPEVVSKDDIEMLQDLILAAVADASRKVDAQLGQQMSGLMGGLNVPGLS